MSALIENFQRDLAEVHWRELRGHLQRDAIILVSPELDISTAAVAVAEDNSRQVESWIAAGQLGKPTREQLEDWEQLLDKPFSMLIVQPFILAQEVLDA